MQTKKAFYLNTRTNKKVIKESFQSNGIFNDVDFFYDTSGNVVNQPKDFSEYTEIERELFYNKKKTEKAI